MVSGPDEYASLAMQSGELVVAMTLYLQSSHRHIKKECLWVLSNLTAGLAQHVDMLIQAGILPLIIGLMSSSFDIKKEVCFLVVFNYHSTQGARKIKKGCQMVGN